MMPIFRWRRIWWWLSSFWQKQKKLILGAGLFSIIVIIFISRGLPLLPQLEPKARIGIVGQYTLTTLPQSITSVWGRGLFKLTAEGQFEPDLAVSWQLNDDENQYRVFLPPKLTWNDGSPLLSTDLVFDLPDVTVSYPDTQTIEFSLVQPYSPFLSLLTRPVFKNKTIGAGGYSIKSIEWQGQWLKRVRLQGENQELDYHFYLSQQNAWLGFRRGEVDRLENLLINPTDSRWQDKVKLESSLNTRVYLAVLFNLSDPNLSSKSFRQALSYALEIKSPDESSRALGPISPDSFAYNPGVKAYNYNPGQALELFNKAREESSPSGELTLTLGTSNTFLKEATAIADSWEKTLPVKVEVKIINSLESDWQAILIAQEIPADPDQHAFWHSTQKTNISHYSDLKVDKLLEDGRQIFDPIKRREIYQDFQRFIAEDSPAIFLYYPTVYTISRK